MRPRRHDTPFRNPGEGLLCAGMRNSQIAERLHRSVRTVDHHLAAVFAKLGVSSRAEAIAAAHAAGIDRKA